MPSMSSSKLSRLFALSLCAFVASCASERPVFVVIESGDRAFENNDYALAATEYREAVSRRPGEIEGRRGLAEALLALDRPDEAREQAEMVYSIRPNDHESINLLARTMLRSGDTAGMETLVRGRANETGRAEDWLLLGELLAEAGDADAAEVALTTAATVDRGQSLAYQKALADFYLNLGDTAQALTRYRMALYIDSADEQTRAAIRTLGEIPGPTMSLPPLEAR
jgi:tetratricopeptide (TPR) repeat protein